MKTPFRHPQPTSPLPVTHWSMLHRAFPVEPSTDGPGCIKSRDEFCRIYWPVIHLSLRQKHGYNHHDAEDLAQSFVAWLLASGCLHKSRQEQGRFRSFLLAHLDNYVRNQHKKQHRIKRGGHLEQVELSTAEHEVIADGLTPDQELQRAWSIATLKEAHERIRQMYAQRGKEALFAALLPFLSADEDERQALTSSAALRMTLPAFRMARSRFRKDFGQCIADLVAATVGTEAEFAEEMQAIRDIAG